MATQKRDTPSKVNLNLDTLEREAAPEPFFVVVGGKRYTFQDPEECDYRDLLESQEEYANGNPRRAIELAIREEDREAFFANRLPGWKLRTLFELYSEHFGLLGLGEADASSPS